MSYIETAKWLRSRLDMIPETAVILGTGLGDMVDSLPCRNSLPYHEIPGFVSSTAPSHKGNLVVCDLGSAPVVFLQGRFHYYEGHPMAQVVFPVRVLAALGIRQLIVTNAAGSLREQLSPGSIVQIMDHINFMGVNPLIGVNDEGLGERFPSMNQPYDPEFRQQCNVIANRLAIQTFEGVYIAVSGPSLESRAECAAFALWGADVVGMSTVPEVIAARHAGMKVLAYSIVTNYSNLFHAEAHSQDEIQEHAKVAGAQLKRILAEFVNGM